MISTLALQTLVLILEKFQKASAFNVRICSSNDYEIEYLDVGSTVLTLSPLNIRHRKINKIFFFVGTRENTVSKLTKRL